MAERADLMSSSKSDRSDMSSESGTADGKKEKKELKEKEKQEKKELKEAKKKEKKEKTEKEKQEKRERKRREIEAEEQKALAEFKQKLNGKTFPNGFNEDPSHLRYLRARKLDADKALEQLNATIAWRESYKPETITPESIQRELATGKSFFIGKDKFGRPAFLVFPGRHEPKAISNDETVRCMVYMVEEAIKKMTDGVDQISILVDFDGWSLKNVDNDLDKMMIDTIQNFYPERLGAAYVVNAPTVFKVAWAVVRPWLDNRTTSKIHFLTGDDWKQELLKDFDPAVLPSKYGGTNAISLDPPGQSAAPKRAPKAQSMKKD